MESLDEGACRDVADRLGGVPVLTSHQYTMYELVSILRASDFMVSSRYHGIVTSMPGLLASAGITMDERIRNLMGERGHGNLLLEVDDPDLEARLVDVLETLYQDKDEIRDGIGRCVVSNPQKMAKMGVYFEEHVQRC
jgi:polysaccharide pyruvyl transferase WcaK-like protein